MSDKVTIDELRGYLQTYLSQFDIKVSAPKFRCFTKLHNDSDFSCHIVPISQGRAWKCFGCNTSGDIFTAAHYLEGLPLVGQDFWKQTVPAIAKRFKLEYDPEALSPADKERYQLLAVYKSAAEYVMNSLNKENSVIHDYLKKREWSIETARCLGIGAVDDFDDYLKFMQSHGWSEEYLRNSALLDKRIFSKHSLIFTIHDLNGRPVAFAGRNMRPKSKDDEYDKYINSPLSPIYHKGSLLYGLDACLDLPGELWIVEGYPDRVTMWQAGIKKVAAIGGTAFTSRSDLHKEGDNHLDVLVANGMTNIILCLDSDAGGILNTKKIIDEHMCKAPTVSVRVHKLPKSADDPDSYIRERGVEYFQKQENVLPFVWRLDNIEHNADPKETVEKMLPLIVEVPNAVTRYEMCQALSEKTNVPVSVLSEEVTTRTSGAEHAAERKIEGLGKELQKKLYGVREHEAIISIVGDFHGKMIEAMEDKKAKKVDYTTRVTSLREMLLGGGTTRRLDCGRFGLINNALHGFPTGAQTILLSGFANVGKTSFLRSLTWELIRVNPMIHVIFMSVDDSFQKIINGFIALETSMSQSFVAQPAYLAKFPAQKEIVWKAYERLESLKSSLVVKDIKDGETTLAMERHINEALNTHPDRKIVFILDNFHKLGDVDSGETAVISAASKKIKRMSTRYNIPLLVNVEMRKSEWRSRSNLRDLKGSASLEYDADLALIMHQNKHVDKFSKMVWTDPKTQREMPINELEFAKNKISEFKGSIYFKFNPPMSRLEEVTEAQISHQLEGEEQRMKKRSQFYDTLRQNKWNSDQPKAEAE